MRSFKLVVLLACWNGIHCVSNYCLICPNHTLCKYPVSSASNHCRNYDESALLNASDIDLILNQINERRNFVALGLSHNPTLTTAGDMVKLEWSSELALMAQRWADQCDPHVNPDQTDECRDMVRYQVGQNIASVIGSAPGLNVRSFVDSWFMQSLEYTGSVTYYNRTRNRETDYFTQLIWAGTRIVGCGRVRFQIPQREVAVDRLVCNFAPKGNIHSKPVYSVGFPATQCPGNSKPDWKYTGLCSFKSQDTTSTPPVSSLLRILNLVNNTQVIDPIQNNMQNLQHFDQEVDRNQKLRHVPLLNKTNGRKPNSCMHEPCKTTNFPLPSPLIAHIRRHQTNDHNEHNKHCTRKSTINVNNISHKCTRETGTAVTNNNECIGYKCHPNCQCNNCVPSYTTPADGCPCTNQQGNANEQQSNVCKPFIPIRYPVANRKKFQVYSAPQFPNYDSYGAGYGLVQTPNTRYDQPARHGPQFISPYLNNYFASKNIKFGGAGEPDYAYDFSTVSSKKRKREDMSFKPFWQVDSFISRIPEQLKSLRYTTLAGKTKLKNRRFNMPKKVTTQMESVTATYRTEEIESRQQPVKEKYLSFDELMNLRIGESSKDNDSGRRKHIARNGSKQETQATTTTTVSVTEPTFARIRHCTRKLTCTWTAPTIPGESRIFLPGGGGSRTPPGYVDGCTRTSTCTRDFMDRNQAPHDNPDGSGDQDSEDEEYCERKSLNVKRSDTTNEGIITTTTSPEVTVSSYTINDEFTSTTDNPTDSYLCLCNNKRGKRDTSKHKHQFTYGKLFYSVLNKLVKLWEKDMKFSINNSDCFCNYVNNLQMSKTVLYCSFLFYLLVN